MSVKRNVGKVACVHCGQDFAVTGIKKHEESCKLNPVNISQADETLEESYEDADDAEDLDNVNEDSEDDADDSEDDADDSDEDSEDDEEDLDDETEEDSDDEEDTEEEAESETAENMLNVKCLVKFNFFWMGSNLSMNRGEITMLPSEFAKDIARKGYVEIQF